MWANFYFHWLHTFVSSHLTFYNLLLCCLCSPTAGQLLPPCMKKQFAHSAFENNLRVDSYCCRSATFYWKDGNRGHEETGKWNVALSFYYNTFWNITSVYIRYICQLFNRSLVIPFLTKIFFFSRAHCFYCFFPQEQSTQDSLTHKTSQNVKNGSKISTQMSILYKELLHAFLNGVSIIQFIIMRDKKRRVYLQIQFSKNLGVFFVYCN